MVKMTLKIRVYDNHFQYNREYLKMHIFGANLAIPVQICDELSCRISKIS